MNELTSGSSFSIPGYTMVCRSQNWSFGGEKSMTRVLHTPMMPWNKYWRILGTSRVEIPTRGLFQCELAPVIKQGLLRYEAMRRIGMIDALPMAPLCEPAAVSPGEMIGDVAFGTPRPYGW